MLARKLPSIFGLVLVLTTGLATQNREPLYICVNDTATINLEMGFTICDAMPTEALTNRLDKDHLQRRPGALITKVIDAGVAQLAGLQPDDVVYRIGGVNVDNKEATTVQLQRIERTADTVVNFLRDGRPYLVRVRQP